MNHAFRNQTSMALDPNWFYSSLAQSAASIIGIFSALLITRLQKQRTEVEDAGARLSQELRARDTALAAFQMRVDKARRESPVSVAGPASESKTMALVAFYGWAARAKECRTRRECDELLNDLAISVRSGSTEALGLFSELLPIINRTRWAFGAAELKADTAMPVVMVLLMAGLSIVGVILPLGYLSALEGRSKAMLLTGFSTGLLVMLVYLGFQIRDIRMAADAKRFEFQSDAENGSAE